MHPAVAPPKAVVEPPALPTVDDWMAAVHEALSRIPPAGLAVARARAEAHRVDGLVIGTGQADFTQGNTAYALVHEGHTFQLLDVPGIEGDEGRFTRLVAQAIAKAHLVFFVNGTNKKPEATTARKIRAYLGRGTQVCVLVNVKGGADAYEFEEDRGALEQHTSAADALRQTEQVLAAALGPDRLMQGQCVQGLLAFSSLALDEAAGQTTIHPSRQHDLAVHQRKYLRAFGTAEAMRRFSRIDAVAQVLKAKARTFREDIVEANKDKVRELLATTLQDLTATLAEHQSFMDRIDPELATARAAIQEAMESFSRLALQERRQQVGRCFEALDTRSSAIVAEHFGDESATRIALQQAFEEEQDLMVRALDAGLANLLATLQQDLHRCVERLLQDLQRADLERRFARTAPLAAGSLLFDPGELKMSLAWGEWGRILLGVGSFATTGAMIGMTLPPFGVFIGAALGTVVGAMLAVLGLFTSHPSKVRKAQADVQARLGGMRIEALASAVQAHERFMSALRDQVDAQVRRDLHALRATLARPGHLVGQQINAMGRILRQVEGMPHGTVQAVHL